MPEPNIVFVIGAGASKDLNGAFPVGTELAENIESAFNKELSSSQSYGPIVSAISRSSSGLVLQHMEAMTHIRNSILSCDSIDDFLSEWREIPSIDQVAKVAVASIILDAERRSALFIESASDADRTTRLRQFNTTWLGRIVRRPTGGPRRQVELALRNVSFIVFNYDRILEQYLRLYFRFVIAKSEDEADALLSSIPIMHAYGSLGEIGQRSLVPYGAQDLFMGKAAEGIRTYNEEHPSSDVERIRRVIDNSDRIVFLGCAFHQQNLRLLFGDLERRNSRVIFGTSLGMRPSVQQEAIQALLKYGTVPALNPVRCSELVDTYFEQIFAD